MWPICYKKVTYVFLKVTKRLLIGRPLFFISLIPTAQVNPWNWVNYDGGERLTPLHYANVCL